MFFFFDWIRARMYLLLMLDTTNRPADLNDSDDLVSYTFCHGCRTHVEDGKECHRCLEADEHAEECRGYRGSF
jgi:hypothetical protein